ncbi:MAG: helix-turn-helix transcriptional regulator [Planctomycetes bacterium]|nr:helix-turn-helix transcriptional regulator [Planctomycetota bacterium]
MKSIEAEMPLLKAIMRLIARQTGPHCEVVLHDWPKGYEHSVVAIENNHITGRDIGSCGSNLGLEVMRGTVKDGDRFNYITQTKDGRFLRSSTTYLKDDDGEPIGALCINFDISDFISTKKVLEEMCMMESGGGDEFFASDVNELLDYLLTESVKQVGKTVSKMNREEKIAALKYLDEKGAFVIAKAGLRACRFFGISKYSPYNYLDEIRNGKAATEENGDDEVPAALPTRAERSNVTSK